MIGLIFGDTDFPIEILKTIKKKKINYLIIDLSKSKKFKNDKRSYSVSIGQFGKIINILRENKCKKVIFAGKVNKPNFSKLKLDFKGLYYIPRIIRASKLGDAAILKEIIKILTHHKIKTESSLRFNPELSLKKGSYSKIKPNNRDKLDIMKAIKTLNNLDFQMTKGEQIRDFISVDNVCVNFLKLIEKFSAIDYGNQITINIGSGISKSVAEFSRYWWNKFGSKAQLLIGSKPYRKNEIMRYVPKIDNDFINLL